MEQKIGNYVDGGETKQQRTKPERKNRLKLKGKIIRVTKSDGNVPRGEIERKTEEIISYLINKGWCVFVRNGFLGLAGYKIEVRNYIPIEEREPGTEYKSYTSDEGIRKTKVWVPRDDYIVFIVNVNTPIDELERLLSKWEVKSHWTVKRNIFDEFEQAWNVFLEIEKRYDPGKIIWTKLEEYENFEFY